MSTPPVSDSSLIVEAKKKAKHLQSMLSPRLPDIALGDCLNFVSRLERHKDWNSYCAKLKQLERERAEVDSYITETALPLIVKTAAKYNMAVEADSTQIEDHQGSFRRAGTRRLPIWIQPIDNHCGDTYCECYLEVSITSLLIGTDFFNLGLSFVFPEDAFSEVAQVLSSSKISTDEEPRLTRCEIRQKQCYTITVNAGSIRDTTGHGVTISQDPMVQKVLQNGIVRFFTGYDSAVKAFRKLQGRWGNKKLLMDFENALWKMKTNEPSYMATDSNFYSTTIAGQQIRAALGMYDPYIECDNGSVAIGVASIIYNEDGSEKRPVGFYIAKYGSMHDAAIHLKGFSQTDVERVTAEFGVPQGRFGERDTSFFDSPAFVGLCKWAEKNPQYAKRIGRKGGKYLPGWYDEVQARKSGKKKKQTKKDFLNAIEKEPYLVDSGIRCSSHVDWKKSAEENKGIFERQRQSFEDNGYRGFVLCCQWLQDCQQRKTINTTFSSYKLKHMVEAWAKRTGRDDYYVSNGAFIAAAIHMGFEWQQDFDSPNVRFNISGKSPAIAALKGRVAV